MKYMQFGEMRIKNRILRRFMIMMVVVMMMMFMYVMMFMSYQSGNEGSTR